MSAKPNETSTVTFYPSFQALAAATAANSEERVRLRPATDYPAEDVAWLWPGKIPLGKLTLLIGDPGLGKSLVAIDVAARVTRGDAFPEAIGQGDKEKGRQGVSSFDPSAPSHSLSPCLLVSQSPCLANPLSPTPMAPAQLPVRSSY